MKVIVSILILIIILYYNSHIMKYKSDMLKLLITYPTNP